MDTIKDALFRKYSVEHKKKSWASCTVGRPLTVPLGISNIFCLGLVLFCNYTW